MDKIQTVSTIQLAASLYQNMRIEDLPLMVEAWHGVLKNYEVNYIVENLMLHAETNVFPPTVADLTKAKKSDNRSIPGHKETQTLMIAWNEKRSNKADNETVEKYLKEMREILGIEGRRD